MTPATNVPLIERSKFFGNPTRAAGRLSPDGRWLSWIAPLDCVLNVWVAPLDKPGEARALTGETGRPIRASFWTPDSKTVLYINDHGGDENFLPYGVDVASGAGPAVVRNFTPFAKTTVQIAGVSPLVHDRILVNFRGSTGFGRSYINAADLQWGRKMHDDDLLDGVAWVVAQGVTTRDKVAIMGGSYGGYATLAGLACTPTEFACGVDIVGPSNLFTLLETIAPYWEEFKQQMFRRMGDPGTDAGQALLKERSPLNAADRIVRPLLIGQGANDPRVNVAEPDQIVAAMKTKNTPLTYVVFPDEGHGFARPVNNIAFNAVIESFLARCLGGRAEPIGDTLKASTAEVRHCAAYTPGLVEALADR